MGDFDAAVSTLLQAFSTGSTVIKKLRRKRKETKTKIDSSVKAEEERLNKSLKTDRKDVKSVYDKCMQTKNFATGDGDAEALSSLASILLRLNAGFMSIIDGFLNGHSTQSDYHTLVNLSNASKLEAIQTFEQLHYRISQSSLSLERKQPSEHRRKKRKHSKRSRNSNNHTLTQSSVGRRRPKKVARGLLKQTYLGPATLTSDGWVRTKHGKKKQTTGSSMIPIPVEVPAPRARNPFRLSAPTGNSPLPLPQPAVERSLDTKPSQRFSIMSFATTSTKIGEIPEHKWAKAFSSTVEIQDYGGARPAFPLHPYEEPEKQPSRLRKMFRRGR